jgi:hypothetical protein
MTIEWSGPCSNAAASGPGIVRFLHNGRQIGGYSGSVKDGKFEGRGILSFTDKFRYDGEWHDGRQHGQGVQVWNEGWRYEGSWRVGKVSGSGTLTAPNGAVFADTWLSGCLRRTASQLRPPIGVGASDCPRTY